MTDREQLTNAAYESYLNHEAVKNEIIVLQNLLNSKERELKLLTEEVHTHREVICRLCNQIYKGREKPI